MSVIPGGLETDKQPPMTVPLRHFVVGLGFLILGMAVGLVTALEFFPGRLALVHVHFLLAGWICITIVGAMTQFVPVWSGVPLYSRWLAMTQLWLLAIGLFGFAGSFLLDGLWWLPIFGFFMLAGFWLFVYNIARTLWQVQTWDVTERHFIIALGFFVLLSILGVLLAIDFEYAVIASLPVARSNVVMSHVTLAVFGAVLTTVLGALYQLSTMFTQTELHGIDIYLQPVEELSYPLGVLVLTAGRLYDVPSLARLGSILVILGLVGFGVILLRRLIETQVAWTPMLSRYAVAGPILILWSCLTAIAWLRDPVARNTILGAPGSSHLLVFGVIGFVVFGTLYHIVPFIIWVHRYSDRLGFESVPMVDDLYNNRMARLDFSLLTVSLIVYSGANWTGTPGLIIRLAGVLALIGVGVFVLNMGVVFRDHSPYTIREICVGRVSTQEITTGETSELD